MSGARGGMLSAGCYINRIRRKSHHMTRFALIFIACFGLSACAGGPVGTPKPERADKVSVPIPSGRAEPISDSMPTRRAKRNFVNAVAAIEPVAEAICRERAPQRNCDFLILVDDTVNAPPNAFQTLDTTGRPIIAFTVPLIAATRNIDEMAFILAHEAAHHIAGHLPIQRRNATIGASIFGGLAGIFSDQETVRTAQQFGAAIGARTYSKDFELEADALGTIIADRAGFDPLRGAEFFFRIPDPGNRFLGTHPANAARFDTVQRTAQSLRR